MSIDPEHTALVLTDPQNDFLSPEGVIWGLVGQNVTENNTVENIESLLKTAKKVGMPVFISPHYYYPTNHGRCFEDSGADWLDQYKPYIEDGETIVASPHKVFGRQANDLALQLRKRKIDKVILAGMSANLCVESHMRDLLEQEFEVAVVKDATAAAQVEEVDGYAAALTSFRVFATAVWNTGQAVDFIDGAYAHA